MKVEMSEGLTVARQILAAARFAAEKHSAHRRKGSVAEPYVNHLIEVAELLARTSDSLDTNLIVAALLHDTIEDAGVTRQEIAERFNEDVAALVVEVTDDKSLPKATRKALQIENAPHKSVRAQTLSAADKISNLRSILSSPPAGWNFEQKADYVRWARQVVGRFGHLNGRLAAEFRHTDADLQEWEKSGGTKDFF
jgi:GTP diphosphokinase / guanosine-3',5'-bis(diphosphate) 3'-diphosphatase